MEDYPDNNPKTAFGMKKLPLEFVPPALEEFAAIAFADGARKYGPFNWRTKKISASVYYAALKRHINAWYDGEDTDSESGHPHLAHAVACLGMLLDVSGTPMFNDNRPVKGIAAQIQRDWLDGKYTRRESEGSSEVLLKRSRSLLAHAGPERYGRPVARLPRLRARQDHAKDGRRNSGIVRINRNKGPRQAPNDTPAKNRRANRSRVR